SPDGCSGASQAADRPSDVPDLIAGREGHAGPDGGADRSSDSAANDREYEGTPRLDRGRAGTGGPLFFLCFDDLDGVTFAGRGVEAAPDTDNRIGGHGTPTLRARLGPSSPGALLRAHIQEEAVVALGGGHRSGRLDCRRWHRGILLGLAGLLGLVEA